MLEINEGKIFLKNIKDVFYGDVFAYLIYERRCRQGWKIHVSCSLYNYMNIFSVVFNYLIENKISFKYIYNEKDIKKFLSGDAPYTQLGKIITIYTVDDASCRNILEDLYRLVKDFEGPYIISDRQYRDSILYFRYGVFENDGIDYLISDNGEFFEDIRDYYNVPEFKNDLFIEDEVKMKIIGEEVIPDSIVHISASGNVYSGLYNDRQIILKEAKNNVLGVNGTAIDDLLNEVFFLRSFGELNKNKLQLIDSFFECGNYYIILNKIEGLILNYHKATNLTFEDYIVVFKKLFNLVSDFHSKGVILNDISLNNFIYSEGELLFIDFGSSYLAINDDKYDNVFGATVDFYDNKVRDLDGMSSDFHKLGYLMMGYICSANFYLRIDSTGKLSLQKFKDYCIAEGILDLYKSVEYLILQKECNYKEKFLASLFNARKIRCSITPYSLSDLQKLDVKQTDYFVKKFKYKTDVKLLVFSELIQKISIFEYRFDIPKVVNWIRNVPDYSLSSGYIGFILLCMYSDIPEEVLEIYIEEVELRILHEKFDSFSLEAGSLGLGLYLLKRYLLKQEQSYLNALMVLLNDIHSSSLVQDGRRYFVDNEFSDHISPYISDGLSGFLFIICQLYHSVEDEDLRMKLKQDYLLEYLPAISNIHWTKFGGLWNGGLGVSMVQIDMACILDNKDLMTTGLTLLKRTIELGVIDDDVLIPVDFIKKNKDTSFMNGFLGNYIVIKYILKIMEGSNEVIFKECFV